MQNAPKSQSAESFGSALPVSSPGGSQVNDDDGALASAVIEHVDAPRGPAKAATATKLSGRFLLSKVLALRVVLTITPIAVLAYIASLFLASDTAERVLKILTAVAAGITFVFSYLQWQLARHEISFDKYYDRLNMANQYINALGLEMHANSSGDKIDHLRNMRVFAQLDNLEYVLGKYKLGFIDRELVGRAIVTFRSDCGEAWFAEKVRFWIGRTDSERVARGYHSYTRKAARFIINHCETRMPLT